MIQNSYSIREVRCYHLHAPEEDDEDIDDATFSNALQRKNL